MVMKIKPGGLAEIQAGVDKIDNLRADDPDVDLAQCDDPQVRGVLDFAQSLMPPRSKELSIEQKIELLRNYLDSMGESYG